MNDLTGCANTNVERIGNKCRNRRESWECDISEYFPDLRLFGNRLFRLTLWRDDVVLKADLSGLGQKATGDQHVPQRRRIRDRFEGDVGSVRVSDNATVMQISKPITSVVSDRPLMTVSMVWVWCLLITEEPGAWLCSPCHGDQWSLTKVWWSFANADCQLFGSKTVGLCKSVYSDIGIIWRPSRL